MTTTIRHLQDEVGPWQRTRWPMTATVERTAMKVGEEAGEVLGAVIKCGEGRRTVEDVANELADVLITACACADLHGIDLQDAVSRRWNEDVKLR